MKLYTVKEAAKLIGVSTNTLYKYLDDGKIHAVRGSAIQGRFRIPESALEEFLGIKLSTPVEPAAPALPDHENTGVLEYGNTGIQDRRNTGLPTKIARILLGLALVFVLFDLLTSRTVSLYTQLSRVTFLSIFLVLCYQEGGYRRS